MIEKTSSSARAKGTTTLDMLGIKQSEATTFPPPQIKMLDGDFSNKDRRQVVMKLIQFMKTG